MNRQERRKMNSKKKGTQTRKVVISSVMAAMMLLSMPGCGGFTHEELVAYASSGTEIVLEVKLPDYKILEAKAGSYLGDYQWLQLDQNIQYDKKLRNSMDKLLDIKDVKSNKYIGKAGVLYVDKDNHRNGNTSLADAFRNKVFVEQYWNQARVKNGLSALGRKTFSDVKGNGVMAALNGYYNLLPNYENPDSFNGTIPVTREQFHALMYRSENGVKETLKEDANFNKNMGGTTEYTRFAKETEKYGYLNTKNGSLDKKAYKEKITKGEAVYALVKKNFGDKLKGYENKDAGFKKFKSEENLVERIGLDGMTQQNKRKLQYMLKYHADGIMDAEMYSVLAYAKEVGIINENFDWGQIMGREEAIQLVVNVQLAKNKVYGFASTSKMGATSNSKLKISIDPISASTGSVSGTRNASELKLTTVVSPNGTTVKDLKEIIRTMERAGSTGQQIQKYLNTYFPGYTVNQIKKVGEVKKPLTTAKKASTSSKKATVGKVFNDSYYGRLTSTGEVHPAGNPYYTDKDGNYYIIEFGAASKVVAPGSVRRVKEGEGKAGVPGPSGWGSIRPAGY